MKGFCGVHILQACLLLLSTLLLQLLNLLTSRQAAVGTAISKRSRTHTNTRT